MQTCPTAFNFARHLIELNQARAEKTAYVDDTRRLTYGELADRIASFAGVLKNLGIRREERILLAMHDTVDWPVVFLGALYAGVIPVAVNTLLTADDFAFMLEHSRAQAIFTSPELVPILKNAIAHSRNEVRHFVVAGDNETVPQGTQPLETLMARASRPDCVNTLADEAAFWLYSSGSTGRPKGVVHCHSNLWYTAQVYGIPTLALTENDVVFSAAKMFFAYGLGNALTFPLSVGATVILMGERPTPDAVFKRLKDHQPTVFCGVPTLYASMLASTNLPARDSLNLRVCTSAGEALPQELGDRFTKHYGCYILDGIGSTEMLHIFLSNRLDDVRYGTTGKPVPGYEISLRDEHGNPVPEGTIGDLYVKGPSAALLYWNNRAKTRETMLGEWLKCGDKYICDEDGYYRYAGRSDDMIKVSGQYVSPVEVENVLVQHESVLEAAVVGIADEQGLVKTVAYVVLRQGHNPDDNTDSMLKDHVKSKLAPFKYPRQIHFVDDLPKTATGKIQRFRLRQTNAS